MNPGQYRPYHKNSTRWSKKAAKKSEERRSPGEKDMPPGVFTGGPTQIAHALKSHSADFKQAMSRLSFYMNSSGENIDSATRSNLERAKIELYKAYGKEVPKASTTD